MSIMYINILKFWKYKINLEVIRIKFWNNISTESMYFFF